MKKILKNRILILPALFIWIASASVACSDWNADQSLDIVVPTIVDKNSELYREYLENLRRYKKTDHKMLIGWFDNSNKQPSSRASHLDALPDSVDIVSLMYPDNLAEWEIAEMKTVSQNKGTKVVYGIDCEAMRKAYNEMVLQNEMDGVPTTQTLYSYLSDGIDALTGLIGKYDYDGIDLSYSGISPDFLTEGERAELSALQDMVFGKLAAVMAAYPDKTYLFKGLPANIMTPSHLDPYRYIVLETVSSTSPSRVELAMEDALTGNVATDRVIVTTISTSPDPDLWKMGYYFVEPEKGGSASVSLVAVTELAKWMMQPHSFGKAGLGVYMINDNYYNVDLDYKHIRQAIDIMNPSPNN